MTDDTAQWNHREGDRYMPIAGSAWMNGSGSGTNYTVLEQPGTWARARTRGLQTRGSDDFNILVLRRGAPVAVLWMNEVTDTDAAVLAEIADQLSLPAPTAPTPTATTQESDMVPDPDTTTVTPRDTAVTHLRILADNLAEFASRHHGAATPTQHAFDEAVVALITKAAADMAAAGSAA